MKMQPPNRFALLAITALVTIFAATAAGAQTYPARPIQVIVPFAGGSASDVVTRILLDRASKSLGQPFVVDNRPGAGGNTGTLAAARSTPDGYTLVATGSGPAAINKALYKDLGYETEKDFEPISLVAVFPIVIVASTKLPVKTLNELVAYALERPNQLNYGSVGIGSSQHLGGVYFEQLTGAKLTHVPYRNIAQYTPDFIAGQVPLGFQFLSNVVGMLSSGDARALAVTSPKRMTALPNVPTAREAGMDYETFGWLALLGPAGMPKPVVDKLHKALEEAVNDPTVRSRFVEQGAEPVSPGPEELQKFIGSETAKWKAIIQKAGIEPM